MEYKGKNGVVVCLVAILAICIPSLGESWNCTTPCNCKWAAGKKTAECKKQNLTEIPKLSSEIQILDLTKNHIVQLESNAFRSVNLVNLQGIILKDCLITAVHSDAFNGLSIVIQIDLSMNKIKTLYPGTFAETYNLRILLLNNNNLQVLESGLFNNMTFLQKVVLSDNQIKRIEDKTFQFLPGLQTIVLHSNNLTTLNYTTFKELDRLGSLELHNNPWICNCLLKTFRDWVIERKLYIKQTICIQPSNSTGKTWDEIKSEDFACQPKIISIGPAKLEITNGADANLHCHAIGTPRPLIFWVHRSEILSNITNRRGVDIDKHIDYGYVIRESSYWTNLTVPNVGYSDKGDYTCIAKSAGGRIEKNITLAIKGEFLNRDGPSLGLPLAIGLGIIIFLLILLTLAFYLYSSKKKKSRLNEKSSETAISTDNHDLGEQEKSLIASTNPVLKPGNRRAEIQIPVDSRGTELTELNRTLLDTDPIFGSDYLHFKTQNPTRKPETKLQHCRF